MNILEVFDWKAIVALLALILSQLPPVRQMIKGKKLRMSVADIAQFTHYFGNTNMSLWIDLENVGAKTITIRRINCFLRRQEQTIQTLTARTYWVTESLSHDKPLELPFPEIALKPGERWSGYLRLLDTKAWTKAIESRVKSVISKVRDDITSKAAIRDKESKAIPMAERPLVEVEADPLLIQEINDILKHLKKIEVGEYEMFVAAYETIDQSPFKILGFDLTIFENDVREIFEDTADYKYGFGVHISSTKTKFIQISIRAKREGKEVLDLKL